VERFEQTLKKWLRARPRARTRRELQSQLDEFTDTGEIIRDLTLDPNRDSQPLGRKPGPVKGSPQRGGRKKKSPAGRPPTYSSP
jgi:hypothetical protein